MANGGFEQDSTVGVPNEFWTRQFPWLQAIMRGSFGGGGTPYDDLLGNLNAPGPFGGGQPNAAESGGMPAEPATAEPAEAEKTLPPMVSRRTETVAGTLGNYGVDLKRDVMTPTFDPEKVRTRIRQQVNLALTFRGAS